MADPKKPDGKLEFQPEAVVMANDQGAVGSIGAIETATGLTKENRTVKFTVDLVNPYSTEQKTNIEILAKNGKTYNIDEVKNDQGSRVYVEEINPARQALVPQSEIKDPDLAQQIKNAGLNALRDVKDNTVQTKSFDELAAVANKALKAAGVTPLPPGDGNKGNAR